MLAFAISLVLFVSVAALAPSIWRMLHGSPDPLHREGWGSGWAPRTEPTREEEE